MGNLFSWRTIVRAVLVGVGGWLLIQPSPLQEFGVFVVALGTAIGSGTAARK